MTLLRDGAELCADAAAPILQGLFSAADELLPDQAGHRLDETSRLVRFVEPDGVIGSIAKRFQGQGARPVRAVLFEKSVVMNWALPWHQDRTICVRERIDVEGFGSWSMKGGLLHVEPPSTSWTG